MSESVEFNRLAGAITDFLREISDQLNGEQRTSAILLSARLNKASSMFDSADRAERDRMDRFICAIIQSDILMKTKDDRPEFMWKDVTKEAVNAMKASDEAFRKAQDQIAGK